MLMRIHLKANCSSSSTLQELALPRGVTTITCGCVLWGVPLVLNASERYLSVMTHWLKGMWRSFSGRSSHLCRSVFISFPVESYFSFQMSVLTRNILMLVLNTERCCAIIARS